MADKHIPNTNVIEQFIGCGLCFEELSHGDSPESYARLTIGFTPVGLQVWCHRHDCNVINMDFEGHPPFPANTTRIKKPFEVTTARLLN